MNELTLLMASAGASEKLYSNDVFSTYLYTGNGSTQTINNGIDLAGKGGLVWTKTRMDTVGYGGTNTQHHLVDSKRGIDNWLVSNTTGAQQSTSYIDSFNSNGYHIQGGGTEINANTNIYASWTFRKAPKFFDVVTYAGNDSGSRVLSHNLGIIPGMVIIKSTSLSDNWYVYHRALPVNNGLLLNTPDSMTGGPISSVTDTTIALNNIANGLSVYVAYLFAHDPSSDGIIQCGSFTTDASGNATVNLGWEPQFTILKSTGITQSWFMIDSMRGMPVGTNGQIISANVPDSEFSSDAISPTATGFIAKGSAIGAYQTYVYLAIRRPNKPPTSGAQVYNAIARTGTGDFQEIDCGINFDSCLNTGRTSLQQMMFDRIRGVSTVSSYSLTTSSTSSEQTLTGNPPVLASDKQNYLKFLYASGGTYISYLFRRAPGVFDVVCYTGTDVARTVSHNLGATPELMVIKQRSGAVRNWYVYANPLGINGLILNTTSAASDFSGLFPTAPSSTFFSISDSSLINGVPDTYVAYLFATLPGISKVGSYTGNGSNRTINCGFTTGARFFLVKATSTTGNWWVFDSARGIISSFDPSLALNSTAAEVTSADAVDPDPSGIIVNQEATCSINATGVNYVFLAIA